VVKSLLRRTTGGEAFDVIVPREILRQRERTQEVGVRRALGATRRDIALQLLVESSLLTTAGGVLGALLGIGGSFAIHHYAEWPTAIAPLMLAVALLMALGVGIGFGFYPAWYAAQLQPMEALRRE